MTDQDPDATTRAAGALSVGPLSLGPLSLGPLSLGRELRGHTGWVGRIAWSPDGRLLASASEDGTVRIWDAFGGARPAVLAGHAGAVLGLAWAPGGRALASAGLDGQVLIWSAEGPRWRARVVQTSETVATAVAWSARGDQLAFGTRDGSIFTRPGDGARPPQRLPHRHTRQINGLWWSPDGRILASAGGDGRCCVWDIERGLPDRTFGDGQPIYALAGCDPGGGTRLAWGLSDGRILVWEQAGTESPRQFGRHRGAVRALAFSPDGHFLASLGDDRDNTIGLWRWLDGGLAALVHQRCGVNALTGLAFHPERPLLAVAGAVDPAIGLWDLRLGDRDRVRADGPGIAPLRPAVAPGTNPASDLPPGPPTARVPRTLPVAIRPWVAGVLGTLLGAAAGWGLLKTLPPAAWALALALPLLAWREGRHLELEAAGDSMPRYRPEPRPRRLPPPAASAGSRARAAEDRLLDLRRLPGGVFLMGADGDATGDRLGDARPRHRVAVAPFLLARMPLSHGDLRRATGGGCADATEQPDDRLPVTGLSWYDAVSLCNRLSVEAGLTPCYGELHRAWTCDWGAGGYRLPTEAEWEYACRANRAGPWPWGEGEPGERAWWEANAAEGPRPVGAWDPNPWGLNDMAGLVWEWCWDWYAPRYPSGSARDPRGPGRGKRRVLRGGGPLADVHELRCAARGAHLPDTRSPLIGVRLARGLPEPQPVPERLPQTDADGG